MDAVTNSLRVTDQFLQHMPFDQPAPGPSSLRRCALWLAAQSLLVLAVFAQPQVGEPLLLRHDESLGSIEYADMDNDGLVDLVALNGDRVVWCRNLGAGQFSGPIVYRDLKRNVTGGDLDVLDADQDGDQDVVVGGQWQCGIWLNDGSGTSLEAIALEPVNSFGFPDHADMNGDGLVDVVGRNGYSEVVWYPGLGSGAFGTGIVTVLANFYAITDMDGDADPDLLIETEEGTSWAMNDGLGNFSAMPAVTSTWMIFPHVGDVDNDGDEDVLGMIAPQVFVWLERTSPSVLDEVPQEIGYVCGDNFTTISVHDIDVDGDMDVYTGQCFFRNTGGEVFEPVFPTWLFTPASLDPFDADGDGDLDFFGAADPSVAPEDSTMCWMENTGDFVFSGGEGFHYLTRAYNGSGQLIAADLNGDGWNDLVCDDLAGKRPLQFLNNGNGTFAEGTRLPADKDIHILRFADMDGDADLDLLTSGLVDGVPTVGLERNDGNAVWGPKEVLLVDSLVYDLEVTDLDNDGDADVILGTYLDPLLLSNDGSGAFADPVVISGGTNGGLELQCFKPAGDTVSIMSMNSASVVVHSVFGASGQSSYGSAFTEGPMYYLNDGNLFFYLFQAGFDNYVLRYTRYTSNSLPGEGFTETYEDLTNIGALNITAFSAMDVDGDGDEDLLLQGMGEGTSIHYMERTGDTGFDAPAPLFSDTIWSGGRFAHADLNHIGTEDLIYQAGFVLYALPIDEDLTSGIAGTLAQNDGRIFPNPAHDAVQIQVPSPAGASSVVIGDMFGRTVFTGSFGVGSMDISALKAGLYVVSVRSAVGHELARLRFVKE